MVILFIKTKKQKVKNKYKKHKSTPNHKWTVECLWENWLCESEYSTVEVIIIEEVNHTWNGLITSSLRVIGKEKWLPELRLFKPKDKLSSDYRKFFLQNDIFKWVKQHFGTLDLFLCLFSSVIKKNEISVFFFLSFWCENVILLFEGPKIYGIFCFASCCNQLFDEAQIPSTLTWQGGSNWFQQQSCKCLHGRHICACAWAQSLHMGGEYPVTVAGPAGLFHCSHSYLLTMNCLLLSDAPNAAQRQICALTQKVSYSESRCGTAKEAHVMLAFVQLLPIESTQHPKSHFLALRKHLQDFFFLVSYA